MVIQLKSTFMSNLLKIMLWALLILQAADFAAMVVYTADWDFFSAHVYQPYGFISVIATIYYVIVVIVYLIWIYQVHVDLIRLYPDYERTPGKALACMMIPFYNLYGIPSTFSIMGSQFEMSRLQTEGKWLRRLAVPLLLVFMVFGALNRTIRRIEFPSDEFLLSQSLAGLILYSMYLILSTLVSRGLSKAAMSFEGGASRAADAPL